MTIWVLFAGLPGTGKSFLAGELAERLNAAILDKDRVRAALFPGSMTDYSQPQDALCMQAMLSAAHYLTEQQRVDFVFFDGRTFAHAEQREEVLAAAGRAGAGWRILLVTCAEEVAQARLQHTDPQHPARNRNPELYKAIQQRFEAIAQPYWVVDTTSGIAGQLEAISSFLRGQQAGPR